MIWYFTNPDYMLNPHLPTKKTAKEQYALIITIKSYIKLNLQVNSLSAIL